MNGLIPALYEGELAGEIYYNNTSLESIKTYDIAKDIGYVSQDPRGHFFTTNTTSELVFAMENFGISLDEMKKRYNAVVELLELEEIVDKNILYISSGERQKIAIGCSLTLMPKVIILDEPSSNLDFRMTKKLTILIEKLKNKGYTIIIAEHRIHYIQKLIDKVLIVNKGMIKEITINDLKNTTDFPLRTLDVFNLQLENISSKNNDLLLQIDNVSYGDILSQISTSINKGDVIGLIGRNGAGKTTTINMITGITDITSGNDLYALAKKFSEMDNCSLLYDRDKKRVSFIIEEAKKKKADGIVVLMTKFCDPEEFDYVPIKRAADEAGIPHINIEVDRQMKNYQQANTMLQTFADMLI